MRPITRLALVAISRMWLDHSNESDSVTPWYLYEETLSTAGPFITISIEVEDVCDSAGDVERAMGRMRGGSEGSGH